MPGDRWQRFATLRTLYSHMAAHPGKKLLFMGGELAQWREWSEARALDWDLLGHPPHLGVHRMVRELNGLVASEAALHEIDFDPSGFLWVDFRDVEQSVLAYLRFARDRDDFVLVANNYTPIPRRGYRLGVPTAGRYVELHNSDAVEYGGSGVRNGQPIEAEPIEFHGHAQSIAVTLPPLGSVWFKRTA
jgi:1,4-alpha-glucan branching enzyme